MSYRFQELAVHYGVFHSENVSRIPRKKKIITKECVMTDIGEIEVAEWKKLIKETIREAGVIAHFNCKNHVRHSNLMFSMRKLYLNQFRHLHPYNDRSFPSIFRFGEPNYLVLLEDLPHSAQYKFFLKQIPYECYLNEDLLSPRMKIASVGDVIFFLHGQSLLVFVFTLAGGMLYMPLNADIIKSYLRHILHKYVPPDLCTLQLSVLLHILQRRFRSDAVCQRLLQNSVIKIPVPIPLKINCFTHIMLFTNDYSSLLHLSKS